MRRWYKGREIVQSPGGCPVLLTRRATHKLPVVVVFHRSVSDQVQNFAWLPEWQFAIQGHSRCIFTRAGIFNRGAKHKILGGNHKNVACQCKHFHSECIPNTHVHQERGKMVTGGSRSAWREEHLRNHMPHHISSPLGWRPFMPSVD